MWGFPPSMYPTFCELLQKLWFRIILILLHFYITHNVQKSDFLFLTFLQPFLSLWGLKKNVVRIHDLKKKRSSYARLLQEYSEADSNGNDYDEMDKVSDEKVKDVDIYTRESNWYDNSTVFINAYLRKYNKVSSCA